MSAILFSAILESQLYELPTILVYSEPMPLYQKKILSLFGLCHFCIFLLQCCVNEDVGGVRQLLEFGADVNIQDNDLWTPLHVAAACGSRKIVELLLEVSVCTKYDVSRILFYSSLIYPKPVIPLIMTGLLIVSCKLWVY